MSELAPTATVHHSRAAGAAPTRPCARPSTDQRPGLKALLDRWREEFLQTSLPIDVFGLASARGIRVKPAAGEWDGRVYTDGADRITIEVNRNCPVARQRFTVAHELVHTAFPGFNRGQRYRVDDDLTAALFARTRSEEERLCDWGAGELLMPEELIWSYGSDQGLRAVERLAHDARVSLEAAALRVAERSKKPLVFLVIESAEHGLRVRYAQTYGLSMFIPRRIALPARSVFSKAAVSGRRERADEQLPGRSKRLFHIEVKSYPTGRGSGAQERLLALAWPSLVRLD